MSMIGHYCKITNEQFNLLRQNKISVSDFLYSDKKFITEDEQLDIDKAWDCINFILTGNGMLTMSDIDNLSPMFNVVMGQKVINNEDIGYGPARYLTDQEVKECNQMIKDITEADFRNKFDIELMIESAIYPLMEDEDGEEFFEYAYGHFKALQLFFERASSEDKYMLLYIN